MVSLGCQWRMRSIGKVIVAVTVLALPGAWAAEGTKVEKPGATFGRKVENTFRDWSLEELPAKVQKTVREQAFGHRINDIDREDRSGRTIWEVRFDGGSHGEPRKVHIDNDGSLVDGNGKPIATGSSPKVQ